MTWVRQAATDTHTCTPPTTGSGIRHAAGSIDDLWQCDDCDELWRVGHMCDACDTYGDHRGMCTVGLTWRPATQRQRRDHGDGWGIWPILAGAAGIIGLAGLIMWAVS